MEINKIKSRLLASAFFISDLAKVVRCSDEYLQGVLKGRIKPGRGFESKVFKGFSKLLSTRPTVQKMENGKYQESCTPSLITRGRR
jgi:hypothetical protein